MFTPNHMNILFIGKACPLKTAEIILQKSGKNPGYQIIKFTDLILKGFIHNQQKVSVLTNISNPNNVFSFSKRETKDDIYYKYLPSIRIPILSQLLHIIYSFIYTFYWCLKTNKDKIIICDIFASSSSRGAIAASKFFNIRRCAIITDMIATPITTEFNVKKIWWRFFFKTRRWNQKNILKQYDQFIFLTQQMNLIYNPLNKPYIVMEGSVDHTFIPNTGIKKQEPRIIMYAGSIEAEYGFNELVQAFMALPNSDVELHIYGNGKFVKTLLDYQKQDSRIKYQGIVSNEQIVALEQQATLLVNPRLSHEDFVKYSFPSKTSEYMLSGTPLLTTKLPGIPEEYFDYLYIFEEETIDGFAKKMQEILSLSPTKLETMGLKAQQFILEHKNNVIQTKRLINFFTQFRNHE